MIPLIPSSADTPAPAPHTWAEGLLVRGVTSLPTNALNRVVSERLARLTQILSELPTYLAYAPVSLAHVTPKRGYHLADELRGHTHTVSCARWISTGEVISAAYDSTIRVWRERSRHDWHAELIKPLGGPVMHLSLAPDLEITALAQTKVHIMPHAAAYEWSDEVMQSPVGDFYSVQRLPDGRVALAGMSEVMLLCRQEGPTWTAERIPAHGWPVYGLHFTSSTHFVSAESGGGVYTWHQTPRGEWRSELVGRHKHGVTCIHALPDGRILSGGEDGAVSIWEKRSKSEWLQINVGTHDAPVNALQGLPTGQVVTASDDHTIRYWSDLGTGTWDCEILVDPSGPVKTLSVGPDGRILSGGRGAVVRIWDGSFL